MAGQNSAYRYPRQVWFVVIMLLVLGIVVGSIALGMAPASATRGNPSGGQQRSIPTSSRSVQIAHGSTPGGTLVSVYPMLTFPPMEKTAAPVGESPSPAKPLSSVSRQARASSFPREDHYWLRRPIAPDANDAVARTYPYGSRGDGSYPIHRGVEFVNPIGTPIRAVGPGTVRVAGSDANRVYGARDNYYGLVVIQELDERYDQQEVYVLYGHLARIDVGEGQHVEAGEIVGLVGMSGVAQGPHVHLEVRYGENDYSATVNPELWLEPRPGMGTLAGLVTTPDAAPVPEVKLVLSVASAPDRPVRDVFTYPNKEVNPDPGWGENFATGDLPAGEWVVKLYYGQRLYSAVVTVEAGKTTWLPITISQ